MTKWCTMSTTISSDFLNYYHYTTTFFKLSLSKYLYTVKTYPGADIQSHRVPLVASAEIQLNQVRLNATPHDKTSEEFNNKGTSETTAGRNLQVTLL